MRARWKIRVYADEREYPLAGIYDSFARLRVLRSWRMRGSVPVLMLRDGSFEFNCPSCGAWWPVDGSPQEPGGGGVSLTFVNGDLYFLTLGPSLVCPVWLAQELGHSYPSTRCEGGRYKVRRGVARLVARSSSSA
ncbi:MAG TPA: hypothetical protein VGB42_00560 [Candidatus Thermoplasmatota archaeon]